ncbi:hypothetical protein RSOL_384320 [Rhizoctonia solani AG-3 Rhs1AP]|uniref:BAG domain-containing protein n=1 Tax=Rhizoctonia solani AG-3 Rhs1AP TaxID=1086054 RepID=X8JBP3_9AGAM|nr:hypothetical protein RSOL_384320 [Rhizoctonia solani AG-3 Rhs1AP]
MFTLVQPACHFYNPPYEERVIQQELQRRRHIEAYLHRQRQVEEMEQRRRRDYEAAVWARRQAELERRRQAELYRRRQARGRHSMYGVGLESVLDDLCGSYSGQARSWDRQQEGLQNDGARNIPTPTPAQNSTPTPAPTSTSTSTLVEPEQEPQVDTTPSHTAVQSILSSLTTLQSQFTFPTRLDFEPNTSKLGYTPNNAPLHGYEHALTGLLTQLDAVESYGDNGMRRARKEAVMTIERELERLDGIKVEVWKRTHEPEIEEPAFVPLPKDVQDAEMGDNSQTGALESSTTPNADRLEVDANQTEPTASSEVEDSTPLEHIDTDLVLAPTLPSLDTELTIPGDAPQNLTLEPPARSLTSPSPSEVSESDSDSDLELEEYVDIETMSTSGDEGTDVDEVEDDGDLELMGDWDMDF